MVTAQLAYCLKCRVKVEIQSPERVTMKNGKDAMRGKCGTCGTKLFCILGKTPTAA